jgi:hypothetical protein
MTMPIHNTSNITHLSDLRIPMLHNLQSSHLAPTTDFTPNIIINLSAFSSVFCIDWPDTRLVAESCNGSNECYGEFIFRGLLVIRGIIANFLHLAPFFASIGPTLSLPWPLDRVSVAQWNGEFIIRALLSIVAKFIASGVDRPTLSSLLCIGSPMECNGEFIVETLLVALALSLIFCIRL